MGQGTCPLVPLYSKEKDDGTIEYSLVNKGTDCGSDWINNGQQLFGKSTDMSDSIEAAKRFRAKNPKSEITMVGHSKGGAEANANAVAIDSNFIIFNPAQVNWDALGLNPGICWRGHKTIFIVKGEALSIVERPVKQVHCDTIFLPQQYEGHWYDSLKQTVSNAVSNHSIEAVIEALKEANYR